MPADMHSSAKWPSSRLTRTICAVVAAALALSPLAGARPVQAREDGGKLPLIRDAEIEQLLRDYSRPILRAAGLEQQNVRIVIINDPTFNAFVMDGRRIFINTGTLLQSE